MKNGSFIAGVYGKGIHSGIKRERKDLAFIFVPQARASAGVFTVNKFAASSVRYDKWCLEQGIIRALVVNSGNANAVTGQAGEENTQAMANRAAESLGLKPSEVAIASTGIIGVQLPMDKILPGIDTVLKDPMAQDKESVLQAILTTDTFTKDVLLEDEIAGKKVVVHGIAKGSGMIAPNMATMLGFLFTNAVLEPSQFQDALKSATEASFNQISVDTDVSTNDMVLMFSTGEYPVELTSSVEKAAFQALLTKACIALAKLIVRDGEGAEKLIEVRVEGASSVPEARRMALNIVSSPLVKTAVHGADPNWGRVIAAAGKDPGLSLNESAVDLYFGPIQVLRNGVPMAFDRSSVKEVLSKEEIVIRLLVHAGKEEATAWGCDLTKGYVEINATYS